MQLVVVVSFDIEVVGRLGGEISPGEVQDM
jgi:hypothetical protein